MRHYYGNNEIMSRSCRHPDCFFLVHLQHVVDVAPLASQGLDTVLLFLALTIVGGLLLNQSCLLLQDKGPRGF